MPLTLQQASETNLLVLPGSDGHGSPQTINPEPNLLYILITITSIIIISPFAFSTRGSISMLPFTKPYISRCSKFLLCLEIATNIPLNAKIFVSLMVFLSNLTMLCYIQFKMLSRRKFHGKVTCSN